ncbi:hypothetical protein PoB_007442900 [Plakobranchus ocellatus]|uniref:Uncharacterized protein n=1 Tax=Plakobranchus ocellatus TaxID=259542 RepID=A0AAV4DV86_9GAST|nr:hypothetical protein PoB_007442900 [Plakobranchus ocellatus]
MRPLGAFNIQIEGRAETYISCKYSTKQLPNSGMFFIPFSTQESMSSDTDMSLEITPSPQDSSTKENIDTETAATTTTASSPGTATVSTAAATACSDGKVPTEPPAVKSGPKLDIEAGDDSNGTNNNIPKEVVAENSKATKGKLVVYIAL